MTEKKRVKTELNFVFFFVASPQIAPELCRFTARFENQTRRSERNRAEQYERKNKNPHFLRIFCFFIFRH